MRLKKYLFTPGPTPVPPEVLAALAEPVIHHRGPDFRPVYERCLARLREVFRTEKEVLLFGGSGTRRVRVGGREPRLARRAGARRLAGSFGERWVGAGHGLRRRRRSPALRLGRDPERGRRRARGCASAGRRPSSSCTPRRRPASSLDVQALAAAREGSRSARRRRRGLEPRRRAARDRRVGPRRRRLRLAEGADDAAGARALRGLAAAWRVGRPATSPRFYWDWEKHAQGAGRSSTRRSRRRSRSSSRSTSRSGCCSRRASRPPSTGTCASAAPAAPA